MTAVFKKPLSETRRPFVVSFSSRSPGFFGAATDLNAVADIVLLRILDIVVIEPAVTGKGSGDVSRNAVRLSGTVVNDRQGLCVSIWVRGLTHRGCVVLSAEARQGRDGKWNPLGDLDLCFAGIGSRSPSTKVSDSIT